LAKHLFDRRVLLVTGKGGVGKTTIAVGLAIAARNRGLNVLLVQLGRADNVGPIFNKVIPTYKETQVESGLSVMIVEPYLALHEYLVKSLKVRMVVDWFLENRVIQYLTQAAPGWRELITIGKIWQLEQMTVGYQNKPKYDLIVVDAPATGHGISFLRVPSIILNTLKFGPVRQHTMAVQKLLLDSSRTLLLGVTLPEEMPVNEVVEIVQAAKKTLHIPYGATIVNAFTPPLADKKTRALIEKLRKNKTAMAALSKAVPGGTEPLLAALKARDARSEMSQTYLAETKKRIGGVILTVPHFPEMEHDRESMEQIAAVFDGQIERGRR